MIPAEAVEAAAKAFRDAHEAAYKAWMEQPGAETPNLESYLTAALEAAAPYMMAAAWQAGKESGFRDAYTDEEEEEQNPYMLNNEGEK